jgi:hypothetical protein
LGEYRSGFCRKAGGIRVSVKVRLICGALGSGWRGRQGRARLVGVSHDFDLFFFFKSWVCCAGGRASAAHVRGTVSDTTVLEGWSAVLQSLPFGF